MAYQFPKRILEEGAETQIDKINNTCRRRTLDMVRSVLKDEYEEVLQDPGELFPFISASGNSDLIDSDQFFREDEKHDERVGRIVALINAKQDWSEFDWEVHALPRSVELSDSEEGVDVGDVTETHVEEPSLVEEPAVVARRGKRKVNDRGAETRKKQLLCQRAAEHNSGISGQMKTFIEGLFTSLKEVVQKDIQKRFDKVDKEMAQLKEVVSKISGPSDTMGKERATDILCPSATMEKDQFRETSQSLSPLAAKEKGKGKADETGVPPTVRRSPRPRKEIETDDMLDFLKNLSQSSKNKDMGTQEYLQDAVGNLSQASHVRGFDPSQKSSAEEAVEISTPLSSSKPADYKTLSLKDTDLHEDRVNDIDYSLVFVPEDSWVKLREWCSTSKQHLKIGPSVYTSELAKRVMGPAVWLKNDRKKEQHLFKWVDEALFDEIQRMDEQHSRMAKEIDDLRSSLNKTVLEEVTKQKNLADVGCLGSMLSILCLCSKRD
ncbi:hypothetical protein HID58_093759 [Brassica napus]|uniref:Uncharacterized protein n=1 Tax=Brassica napus TaxID=3708 RepID=A0ABQ7X9S6_BRANA|nr:hypothetical protein HID58_093759 [Brassica napus]